MGYSVMRPDGVAAAPAMSAGISERKAYIAKVYGVMMTGLLVFFASIALPLLGNPNASFSIGLLQPLFALSMFLGGSLIGIIVSLALIMVTGFLARSVMMIQGVNLVFMYLLAGFWGILTTPLVMFAVGDMGAGVGALLSGIVLQALGLTVLVFGSLSGYVLLTKKDFSWMGGMLFVGVIVMFIGIGVSLVLAMLGMGSLILSTALACFIILLFSGYVLYDTSNILHHYSTDMVVPGALALMIDFIILFREILFLLAVSRD